MAEFSCAATCRPGRKAPLPWRESGWGEGDSAWPVLERRDDRLQDAGFVVEHVVVPESQNPETLPSKVQLPRRVFVRMLPAIDLDDEPCLEAGEVDDVVVDRMLASELMAAQNAGSEGAPEGFLGLRGLTSQSSGALYGHFPSRGHGGKILSRLETAVVRRERWPPHPPTACAVGPSLSREGRGAFTVRVISNG